ncbi:phage tail tape measure protein [Comamonas testosteroni]|uniref:Phage tail tape measure protein n=1 Tax=Comamonas testosteroni TaxID=285 RepID=A0A373FPP0_COMTE|nr:phage tail tape measure protein [Comamonas testosteroni]RGE46134.1 phage tail tape measure protein [Comamonas testosteroni]
MAEQNMRLRVMLDLADRALGPLKRISQGGKETAAALKETRAQLKQLNAQQNALGNFDKHTQAMRESSNQLKVLKQQLQTMTSTGQASASQIKAHQAAIEKQTAKYKEQQATVFKLRSALTDMGITNASQAQAVLGASIATTTAKIKAQSDALKRQAEEQRKLAHIQQQSAKAAAIGGGMAAAGAVGVYTGKRTVQTAVKPVQSYMQHEDAMLGIARQVPGARDSSGQLTSVYTDIEAQVRELSTRVPLATTQIAEMFTAAARMEVPTDKLSEFVLMTSEMATAFDAVPAEIADSMGKIANNLKIPVTDMRGMADAINYLDDNAISKGADIIGFLNRVGGVAGVVSIKGQEMAALGSTLLTSGETEETAGTAVKAIFTNFAAATKGTKKFQHALGEIGLTAKDVQAGMATDSVATLLKISEAIKKLPKKDQLGVMAELAGKEHVGRLAKLVTNTEELRRQIGLANSEEAKGSMAREAAARNATMSAQGQMTDNRVFNLKAVIGESLKNEIKDLLAVVNPLLERFTAWVQANPALVGGVLKAAIMFGVLMAGVSALLIPLGLLIAKGMLMRFVFARLASWVMGSGGAMGLLQAGAARLAGGFGLLVRWGSALFRLNPFAALAAGLFGFFQSITQNWGKIKAAFSAGDWSSIGGFILKGLEAGLNMATLGLYGFLKGVLTGLIKAAKWVLGIQSPSTVFAEMGAFLIEGLIVGMRNLLGALWGFVSGAFNGFVSWLGGLWVGIQSLASEAWGRIVATVSSLLNMGVGEWMQVFLNFSPFGLIWNALTSALSMLGIQVPEQFRSFGGFIIDGLIGGITNKLGALRDTVVNAATSAAGWFKEKLGINSPSRVFTQFGGWISEGAAVGIEGGQAGVRAAALAMASAAMAPMANATLKAPGIEVPQAVAGLQQVSVQPVLQALPKLPAMSEQMPPLELPAEHRIAVQLLGLEHLQRLQTIQPMLAHTEPQLEGLASDGSDAGQRPYVNPLQPLQPMRALQPIARRAAGPVATGGNTYPITINAAPGMDPQAIARAVATELDRREQASGAKRRSSLSDLD